MCSSDLNGVSPYGSVLLAAVGLMFSTVLATPFMVNFPVAGAPVRITEYFRSKGWQHMLGWLGGALLCCGVLSAMVVASSPAGKLVGPVWGYALGHASPLVTAILGMLIWRELRGSTDRSRNFVMASVVLFAAGIALVAVAPLYTTK